MPNINYPFTTPANYTFDSNDVEVVGGVAQCVLQSAGGQVFNEDFANDTDFTYDSAKAEFVGGLVRQKDQTPSNSVFGVTYDTDANPITVEANLNWNKPSGSLTATLNGAPTIVGGKLVCTGTQGLYYVRDTAPVETHKFKYTPNYTGASSTNINFIASHTDTGNNDRFVLTHTGSAVRLWLRDKNAVIIHNAIVVGNWNSGVAGVEYEFEVVIDSILGTFRVFIEGILLGTLNSAAWTRDVTSHRYYIGAFPDIYNKAEASFDDYITFNDAQHTASYTPGYTIESNIYSNSIVELPEFSHTGIGVILSLDGLITTEVGTPRYTFEVNTNGHKYWDGAAWVDSDGTYAQANDVATANTNLSTYPVASNVIIHVHVIFNDGTSQSSVSDLTINHTGNTVYTTTNPTIVPTTSMSLDGLNSFLATLTIVGSDEVRFALRFDGQDKYWDGAAWSNADGTYTQTNDLATVQANLASWTLRGDVFPVIYLHSDDGSTTPNIDDLTISFDFYGGVASVEGLSTVWMYVYDEQNNPREGVEVQIQPLIYGNAGDKLINLTTAVKTTDSSGYVEFTLIETDSITDVAFGYQITIKAESKKNDDHILRKYVPVAVSANILDLPDVP